MSEIDLQKQIQGMAKSGCLKLLFVAAVVVIIAWILAT